MRAEDTTKTIDAAIQAAVWAPSVHNTQPWSFAVDGEEIALRADSDRKLRVGDITGREQLISCGAALENMRIALRAMGREALVRVLPDPDRPALLATVRLGEPVEADEHTLMLYGQVERRRTHRAGFTDQPIPDRLLDELTRQAALEGARLTPIRSLPAVRVLAALTEAAQEVQAQATLFTLDVIRWGRAPESGRADGVPAAAYPREPVTTEPAFPQRDYAHGRPWGGETDRLTATSTGLIAVLTTLADTREDWIAAGQALQRVLLHAGAHDVRAAFHTQSLEMLHLREFARQELLSGEYPQMIMRLGFTPDEGIGVRRPIDEVREDTGA